MALQPYHHCLKWFSPRLDSARTIPPPEREGVMRTWVPTPGGNLELLYSLPHSSRSSWKPALLFIHGGFEQASCFINFLPCFSHSPPPEQELFGGHPCFAISLRGHGNSYQPGFLRMYFTSKYQLTQDICAAIKYICTDPALLGAETPPELFRLPPEIILFGHASGGGLAQYLLQSPLYQTEIAMPGAANVIGLGLLGAMPCFGSLCIWKNWILRLDPWAIFRFWHLGHPRSPLSSTALVRGAFFSNEMPEDDVIAFEKGMPEWESMLWFVEMIWNGWIDIAGVLRGLLQGGVVSALEEDRRQRILVVAGGKDRLIDVAVMEQMTAVYRGLWSKVVPKVWGSGEETLTEEVASQAETRVAFEVVEGSGHHLMKDVYWKDCAEKVARWLLRFSVEEGGVKVM
ncbi:Alpha/Beta hydrolase protein [Kalaharituber pfeilii]|nr:Alpha/Beta hydrolase protein [Kalaharituber pfeilii]